MSVRIIDTSSDKPFVVELDSFSGPLDLLLHLIREQEIDIADIPIASVADQFFSVIRDLGLNQAAEYLEMAAPNLWGIAPPAPMHDSTANRPPHGFARTPATSSPMLPGDPPIRHRRATVAAASGS